MLKSELFFFLILIPSKNGQLPLEDTVLNVFDRLVNIGYFSPNHKQGSHAYNHLIFDIFLLEIILAL